MCTKLGALALAALLRRGHEEYMKDEKLRTAKDNEDLLAWAEGCNHLTTRVLGGMCVFMCVPHVHSWQMYVYIYVCTYLANASQKVATTRI
jgi:hypothetical protein